MRILIISLASIILASCAVDRAFQKTLHGALNSGSSNYSKVAVVSLLGDAFWNYGGGFTSVSPINEEVNKVDWQVDQYADKLAISTAHSGKYKLLNPTNEQRKRLIQVFKGYKNRGDELAVLKAIIPAEYDALVIIWPMHQDRVQGGYGFYSYNMLGIQGECPYVSLSMEMYDLKSLDRKAFAPGHSQEYCADANTGIKVKNFNQYSSSEINIIKNSIFRKIDEDIRYASDTLNLK